jgi:hypothetical protein
MAVLTSANRIPTIESSGVGGINVSLDQRPNECPICHVTIEPEFLTGAPLVAAFNWLEAYYRCTNMKCRRHFTAFYKYVCMNGQIYNYELLRCDPVAPQPPGFDPVIESVSPIFVQVFSQSTAAEGHGLADVAGPGFRKSLEFLVKDYAIQLNPGHDEEIKRAQLGTVIREFLSGGKLSVVSSRAAWLGNDETHYERRWIDKDLKDLKNLIRATAYFIAMERLAAELPADMPAAGPASAPVA